MYIFRTILIVLGLAFPNIYFYHCYDLYNNNVYISNRAKFALIYRINIIGCNSLRMSDSTPKRAIKYSYKGFAIYVPGLNKNYINSSIFDDFNKKVVGLAYIIRHDFINNNSYLMHKSSKSLYNNDDPENNYNTNTSKNQLGYYNHIFVYNQQTNSNNKQIVVIPYNKYTLNPKKLIKGVIYHDTIYREFTLSTNIEYYNETINLFPNDGSSQYEYNEKKDITAKLLSNYFIQESNLIHQQNKDKQPSNTYIYPCFNKYNRKIQVVKAITTSLESGLHIDDKTPEKQNCFYPKDDFNKFFWSDAYGPINSKNVMLDFGAKLEIIF